MVKKYTTEYLANLPEQQGAGAERSTASLLNFVEGHQELQSTPIIGVRILRVNFIRSS